MQVKLPNALMLKMTEMLSSGRMKVTIHTFVLQGRALALVLLKFTKLRISTYMQRKSSDLFEHGQWACVHTFVYAHTSTLHCTLHTKCAIIAVRTSAHCHTATVRIPACYTYAVHLHLESKSCTLMSHRQL